METNPIATNTDEISVEKANDFLAAFDPTFETGNKDYVSIKEESKLFDILKNPDKIDSLDDFDADALCEEGNRIFCKGGYDYMMVNSTYDDSGKMYDGVENATERKWTPKATLKQMANDIVIRNAAIQGVDALGELLNGNNGKRIGWSGEQYANSTYRQKAARIKEVGAIGDGTSLKSDIANWWSSWNLNTIANSEKSRENLVKYGPEADIKYESCVWDWSDVPSENADKIRNEAISDAVKTGFTSSKRNLETGEVTTTETKYANEEEFAQAVYSSPNHVFKSQNGDVFAATLVGKDKYRLELARGGDTEKCYRVTSIVEDKNQNERNAMNAIVMREMFNANPELLRWYQQYDASRRDNKGGMMNRKGDTEKLLKDFMEEFRPYAKSDSELTQEEIGIRNGKVATFQQLCEVLAMDDKREGLRNYGGMFSKFSAGIGNIALDFAYEVGGLARDGVKFYADFFKSIGKEDNYFNQFKEWAEEDLKAVTASETFDQGTLTGLVGGEAAKLFAFSAVMKGAQAGNLVKYAGKSINSSGRLVKLVGKKLNVDALKKAGQGLKSVGAKVDAYGRGINGGSTYVINSKDAKTGEAVGFQRIEIPKNGKKPEGAIELDGNYYKKVGIKKSDVGNFMEEFNAKANKFDSMFKKSLEEQKAKAAEMGGKVGVSEEYANQIYDSLKSLDKKISDNLGSMYGDARMWALNMANELPSVMLVGGAMAENHKAQSAYKVGEGFLERDENGAVVGAKFDYKPFDTVKEYAVYDAAGNSVFMFKLSSLMDGVIRGVNGSAKLQQSTRNWYKSVVEMYQKGEYNKASALVSLLDQEIRRRAVTAAHMFATGGEMAYVDTVIQNAENISLQKMRDPEYKPELSDYLADSEQAIECVKSGLKMAAGGVAVGEAAGSARALMGGEMPYLRKLSEVGRLGKLDALSRDSWAIAAGVAYKNKKAIRYEDLSAIPEKAIMQVNRQAQKDEIAYKEVSESTFGFVNRYIDSWVRRSLGDKYESYDSIRKEMSDKYGEQYARIMDGITDTIRTKYAGDFVRKFAEVSTVKYDTDERSYGEFTPKEIIKAIESELGNKIRRPKVNKDGSIGVNLDVDGKNGWLNLTFKTGDLDAIRKISDGVFSKGWATDVMNALEGKNTEGFDVDSIKGLSDKVAKLDETIKAQLREGKDFDGILEEALGLTSSTGAFVLNDGNGRKVAVMNAKSGRLHVKDFAHEAGHGVIETLRERGFFTGKDGENREDFLRKRYGGSGNEWEELFLRDLFENSEDLAIKARALDGVKELNSTPFTKLISGVGKLMNIYRFIKPEKPKRSRIESYLDKTIEDAKNAVANDTIDKEADAVRSELDKAESDKPTYNLTLSQTPVPNAVFMDGVSDADKPIRVKQLNDSGFYYDSNLDVWVNEHSAPTVYHRAVNKAIAVKCQNMRERTADAFKTWQSVTSGKLDMATRTLAIKRVKELIQPEQFTKSERDHLGIVVSKFGEPLGVINSQDGTISDGETLSILGKDSIPDDATIVPFEHDLYGRWAVKTIKRGMTDKKMIAIHNLSAEYAEKFLDEGESAGISVGVLPEGQTHNAFGLVSFVFGRNTIDPKSNEDNFLFDRDMGTGGISDFMTSRDANGNVVRSEKLKNEGEEFYFETDENGKPIAFDTPEKAVELMRQYLDFEHNQYPNKESKDARAKTVEALKKKIGPDGKLPYIMGEAKLARLCKAGEIIGASIPRFTAKALEQLRSNTIELVDVEAVNKLAKSVGRDPKVIIDTLNGIINNGESVPAQFSNLIKTTTTKDVDPNIQMDRLEAKCKALGIPVVRWDYNELVYNEESGKRQLGWTESSIAPRTKAIQELQNLVPDMRFNVVGVKGASRYFGPKAEEIRDHINLVIRKGIEQSDLGTRIGLGSSKNANLNDAISGNVPSKVGPFFIHVGGVDGDKGARLEYVGKKPKMPQAFLKRIAEGEQFHVYDIMGNAVKQDEILAKAYPEIMNASVFVSNSKQSAELGVKEPAWRDDNTFILPNEDGQIVINQKRWNERLAPEQFAQALVGLIQKEEGWEQRIRTSDVKTAEALIPSRAKRSGSELSFWLTDPRLINSAGVGKIVEKAIRDRLGDKVNEQMLKKVSEVIWEEIDQSVKQFAGEAEARFLASRFGMSESELADYSKAEEALKNTLVTLDSKNLTSAQQTKKNLSYWNDIIISAVDTFLFNSNAGRVGKNGKTVRSIRPEFRNAVADEVMEAIVKNILQAKRTVRTQTESDMSGVEVGGKLDKIERQGGSEEVMNTEDVDETSTGSRLAAGFAMMNGEDGWDTGSGGRTLVTSGSTVTSSIEAEMESRAKSIDVRWERNKGKVATLIKEEVSKMKQSISKDFSKAEDMVKKFTDTLYKIVADNSLSKDASVQQAMLNEAIRMSGIASYVKNRVVGTRRSPKALVTEAASARLAKQYLDGKRGTEEEQKLRSWVEKKAEAINLPVAEIPAFVDEVMRSAVPVAENLYNRFKGKQNDVELIKSAKEEVAVEEVSKRIVNGAIGGYNIGRAGQQSADRAVLEAKRLQIREVKNARGMGLAELNSLLGRDIVKDIENMKETFGDSDALATQTIKAFSDKLLKTDGRFANMTYDEFVESPIARAELANTVSSWLRETAKRLGYDDGKGAVQVREWAMRESARIQNQLPTFASAHMTIAKYADMLSESIAKHNVGELLDNIDKQIDLYADGEKSVSANIPDYQRKISPRLQEYWKYVKEAMRMTDEAVEKEIAKQNNILKLSDMQLLELGKKDAKDIDAEEQLLSRDKAMMKLNALSRFGAMKYKTYGECREIFDGQMARDLAGAIQAHLVKRNARLADDASIRQAFIGELTSIRRNLKGDDFDKLENGTKGSNFLLFSIADLFKRFSAYLHEGTEAYNFIDSFRQDMSLANIDKTMFISKWEGEMRKACEDIYGVNFEKLVPDMMLKNPEYDKFSRTAWYIPEGGEKIEVNCGNKTKKVVLAKAPDGSTPTNIPNHLSKANLIYIYAACQQRDMQVNNAIWGRDAEYFRAIEDIIGPEGVAMANWLTRAYGEIRKVISPISEDICGMPVLSPDENYCPLSFEQDLVSNDERRYSSSPFPAFLTRRVTHDSLRLKEQCDAFRMFEDKIQDSGHYIGYAKIIDRMNSTLKHPKVQTAYAQLYGTKAKNDIYAQLADALNGGRKNSDTLLSGVRNFVTATSLFGNIGSAMKQLEGIGGWSVEMGIGPWVKGLIRNPMTSAEVRNGVRELIDAGLFVTRECEGISEAMVSLMNSCEGMPEGPMSKGYRWYKRHGMDITKWVDKIASMSMAGQYYTGRKNWYIENGLTEQDAKRRALADTDYAIQTTQQSGRSEFLHSAQRAGTAGKMITQFSGPAFVRWGIECETWHRAMVMGDKGAWANLASRLISLHLICPAILSLAGGISSMMFKRDDQKMKDIVERTEKDIVANCITGPMSGWFIWGQIINAFAYENVLPDVKGSRSKTHFEAPVLSKLHSLQQMTSKMYKDVIESSPWDGFSKREERMIKEDSMRIFQMLFPIMRTVEPIKALVK